MLMYSTKLYSFEYAPNLEYSSSSLRSKLVLTSQDGAFVSTEKSIEGLAHAVLARGEGTIIHTLWKHFPPLSPLSFTILSFPSPKR